MSHNSDTIGLQQAYFNRSSGLHSLKQLSGSSFMKIKLTTKTLLCVFLVRGLENYLMNAFKSIIESALWKCYPGQFF